jgi:hypothetical protein
LFTVGGTNSSGRLYTVFVDGAYWMSCISSFWKTTAPGVAAMLTPSSKLDGARRSTRPWPLAASARRLDRPWTRFSPPVSSVFLTASGLVSG